MRTILGILTLLLSAPAAGQTAYLPLEIGNEWTYALVLDPPDAPPDTVNVRTYALEETVRIDGSLHYVYDYPFAFTDTVRVDADGRVWERRDDGEVVLFDFTLADGEVYTYFDARNEMEYRVTVERREICMGIVGEFADCISFAFDDPVSVDEERSFMFARDVGLVGASGEVGDWRGLLQARVGGQMISTPIELDDPYVLSASVYPNPSPGTINLLFTADKRIDARISVFDVLGRRIVTMAEQTFAAGAHNLVFAAHPRAAGVYFIVVETEKHRITRSLILTK